VTDQINLEHTHNRLMRALRGIAEGKGLDDAVTVPPTGTQTIISHALVHAKHLPEPFVDFDTVDAAFARLGIKRTSDRKDECAAALMAELIKRRRTR
jgi:hypothetical protein